MSGHSKWSTIKRKKGAADARRGKIFTKLIKEITVATRLGGGDSEINPRLRTAIASAKAENMPKENIERAIKKGTGELEGISYEELTYEGYGPGGVAVLVEAMTDNKKKIAADLRYIFSKNNGNLGEAGCVSWMFEKKGLIVFEKNQVDEEKLMEVALEAGAEDIKEDESNFEVITEVAHLEEVKKAIDKSEMIYVLSEISMIPQNYIELEEREAQQMLRLMNALEEHEDVQHVYANFDIPERLIEELDA
jgi:YebC/PmpR family DNA-binding regulatory protein